MSAQQVHPQIRSLRTEDAAAYQVVRLQALQHHPEAFGSSYEEEVVMPVEQVAARLSDAMNATFGWEEDGKLLGITTLVRNARRKLRHRAHIVAVFVFPEARGRGIARALLQAALQEAASHDEILDVVLDVTAGNDSARALYVSEGFETYAVQPRQIYTNGRYYDTEQMMLVLREANAHG